MPDHSIDIPVRVRYPECDPMNVVHHSVYPVWMEMARTDLLRQTGVSYRQLETEGVYFVVTRLTIAYKQPAFYDNDLVVRAWVKDASRVRIDHAYEIRRDEVILATAETTLACVGKDGRVRAMPDVIQSHLTQE